jgi:orotidine-5'-phosphate decarboxylase
VELLADHVGMFKVGLELFIRCGPAIVTMIRRTGRRDVFLDLKLHDIPETVRRAMAAVADLDVALATVHSGENQRMLGAAVAGAAGRTGVLAVTVLTSVSSLDLQKAGFVPERADNPLNLVLARGAAAKAAGCAGVVCSPLEARDVKKRFGADFLVITPGIRPADAAVHDQQRLNTPAQAIRNGADGLVIGRPIRDAADPVAAARQIAVEIQAALEMPPLPTGSPPLDESKLM